jgi:L-arabinose isomerase
VKAPEPMPKLPVAHAVWIPRPDFRSSCEAWILAGGAHHTSFGRAVAADALEDLAAMVGIEFIRIGHGTDLRALKNQLRWNDSAYASR